MPLISLRVDLFLTATQKAHNAKLSIFTASARRTRAERPVAGRLESLTRVTLSGLATALTLMELSVSTRQVACKAVTKSMHSHLQGCFRGYANEQDLNVTF